LNRNFKHNPDLHLRSAHTSNPADPEREPLADAIRARTKIAEAAPAIDEKLSSKPEAVYSYMRGMLLSTYQSVVELTSIVESLIRVDSDPTMDKLDRVGIFTKKYKTLLDMSVDMKKIAEPLAVAETLTAWKIDPPVDVFHQLNRYLTNHYEQLRDVVDALYDEKSDFEYSAILYDAFTSPEAAREYRIQHESEFKSEVLTIENSGITLIGPFKENRDRVDFYNKHTEIMKRMMEQIDSDHKLGKDLMEKQVKNQKRKNIAEMGPDAPGLAAYAKAANEIQDLGARKVLTKEETERLIAAQKAEREIREDFETPDDSIRVDVFFPQTTPDGQTTLAKTKFFSQAEAPLHLQENSVYRDQYQPKRADGETMDTAYRTKTIIGKSGQKMEIRVPASEATDSVVDPADPHGKGKDKSRK
jgi:hypothetical protein